MNSSINQNPQASFGATVKYGKTNKEIGTTMGALLNADPICATPINNLVKELNAMGNEKDVVYLTAKNISCLHDNNRIQLTLRTDDKSKGSTSIKLNLRDYMACCAKDDSSDSIQIIDTKIQQLYNKFLAILIHRF